MEHMNIDNIEEIFSYLIRKKEYYEKILELTEKQDEAIQSDNTRKLDLITTAKENCIKEIKRLDKLNIKIQEELKTNSKALTSDKRLSPLLDQLQSIITKIQNYDLDSISLLHSSIKNTKAKLGRLNKRKISHQSMKYQGVYQSRFVDVIQ